MKKSVTILFAVVVLHSVAIAGSQVCNVPITLTNSQNTATPDSFQQMVTVNSSLFSSLEMSGLENIEFTAGSPAPTGAVLQTWIESGNSSSSANTVYWVNLGNNVIPANGTLTIYMNFMSSAVMSAAGPTGEAPDISATYAQYDNGGLVFPHVYTRWGGLSGGTLPTTTNGDAVNGGNITSISTPTYGSLTITNNTTNTQLVFNGSYQYYSTYYPTCIYGAYYDTTPPSSYTYPTVLESKVLIGCTYSWFGTGNGDEEEGWGAVIANDNNLGANPTYSVRSNHNLQPASDCGAGMYPITDYTSLSETNPVVNVWTILLNNVNDTDQLTNVMYNYTQIPGLAFPITIDGNGATVYQAPCNGGPGTLFGYFGVAQNTPDPDPYDQVYWTRTRAFPPNGVMPTATLGDTTAVGATALIFPVDTLVCPGASVTLIAEGGISYTWSNNDTGSVITVNPTTTSVFIVTATTGCGTGSDTAVISVDTTAQALTILPLDTSFCDGQSATLHINGGGFNYTWSPSASLSDSTGLSVVATPTVTTTYTITGTDSLGCAATGTDVVTVIPSPNKPTFMQQGDTLISSSTNDNQWYYNDGLLADTSRRLVITDTGEYWVIVNNEANGCSTASDSVDITSLTGINQLTVESGQLTVYPNPFTNRLTITSSQLPIDEIDITNELGQVLYSTPLNPLKGTFELDLSNLSSGMYFITVINKTGWAVVPMVKQ